MHQFARVLISNGGRLVFEKTDDKMSHVLVFISLNVKKNCYGQVAVVTLCTIADKNGFWQVY